MSIAIAAEEPKIAQQREWKNRALVRVWLYAVLVVLFALVLVGGATRLTDSGLSITEWKPIHGVIPPLNEAEWQAEFEKYQQIPEYEQVNHGMTLAEFKTIFWWEWAHRLLARGVGLVFALPLVVLLWSGRIERGLGLKLAGLFVLGGLQGAVGWWMVASGLSQRVDVSQYRLALHLTLACVIFAAIMVVARGLAPHSAPSADRGTQRFAGWLVVAVLFQIYLGGLVAGLDAGLAYNTWPLMDGQWLPDGLFAAEPWWINFFENALTVQFIHRLGAYAVFLLAFWHLIATWRRLPGTTHALRALLLFLLVAAQAAIGITTLLMQVPLDAALAHQAMALILLGFAAAHWRGTKGSYPLPTAIAVSN
jgi:heme a synthase